MSSSCSTQEGARLLSRSKTLMAKLSSVFRPSSASRRRSFPSSSFRFGSLLGILLTEGILFSRSQSNRYLSRLLRLWFRRQTRTFAEYIAQLWTRDGRGGQTGDALEGGSEGGRDRRIKDRERGIPISYAVRHKGRHSFLLFLPSPPIGLANSSCFLHAAAAPPARRARPTRSLSGLCPLSVFPSSAIFGTTPKTRSATTTTTSQVVYIHGGGGEKIGEGLDSRRILSQNRVLMMTSTMVMICMQTDGGL